MKNSREEIFAAEAVPHLSDLYRTAVRLTREQLVAEDIVQEVFLQAWKSFEAYEAGTNCPAWLYKILFFKIIYHRRTSAARAKLFCADDEEGTLVARAVAAPKVPQRLTDEDIIAAVDSLSANFRAVVLLADVEEFSYLETAEILRIPVGTVMSRLSRARRNLRESLAAVAPEYGFKNSFAASVNRAAVCAV